MWLLYIAARSLDAQGLGNAYRRVYASLDRMSGSQITPSDVKLVDDSNSIAKHAAEVRDRSRGTGPVRYHGRRLGGMAIVESYIYPPVDPDRVWLRQSYTVTYVRQGETNTWAATIVQRELYRGVKARGAISYSTAMYEGEKPSDQKFAMVTVLVEVDPRLDEQALLDTPGIRQMMVEQARKPADEQFRSRHPDAVIEHHESWPQ